MEEEQNQQIQALIVKYRQHQGSIDNLVLQQHWGNIKQQQKMKSEEQLKGSLPFIQFSAGGGFSLHPSALKLLQALPKTPLHILTVVGKHKAGKSYLANHLLSHWQSSHPHKDKNTKNAVEEVFKVDGGMSNGTHGMTISSTAIPIDGGRQTLLVIDTQGIGSTESTNQQDYHLFAMAMLISSTLLLNTPGAIDEPTLSFLSIIIQISKIFDKGINGSKNKADTSLPVSLPSLFWLLKDFSLKMEDRFGSPITSKEYMESALEQQKGAKDEIIKKNRIRRVIKQLFVDRTCQTIVLPSEQVPIYWNSKIRPQFKEDVKRIQSKLMKMVEKNQKKLNAKSMHPSDFIVFLEQMVLWFNNNLSKLPRIETITIQLHHAQVNHIISEFNSSIQSLQIAANLNEQSLSLSYSQSHDYNLSMSLEKTSTMDVTQIEGKIVEMEVMISKVQDEFRNSCEKISQLLGVGQGTINHDKDLSSIREFKQLTQIKNRRIRSIKSKAQELRCLLAHLKANSINTSLNVSNNLSLAANNSLKSLIAEVQSVGTQSELDQRYTEMIKELRLSAGGVKSDEFRSIVQKLQIAYLRRKLELKARENEMLCKHCCALVKLEEEEQERHSHPLKNKENQQRDQTRKDKSSKYKAYIRINEETQNRQQQNIQNQKQSHLPLDSKSFYIPYFIISSPKDVSIDILRTLIKQDSRGNSFFEYALQVSLMDRRWVVNRKWKDFSELGNILGCMFPKMELPHCSIGYQPQALSDKGNLDYLRREEVQERRRCLQKYMKDLMQIDFIRNSRIMQKFIKINKEFITKM